MKSRLYEERLFQNKAISAAKIYLQKKDFNNRITLPHIAIFISFFFSVVIFLFFK